MKIKLLTILLLAIGCIVVDLDTVTLFIYLEPGCGDISGKVSKVDEYASGDLEIDDGCLSTSETTNQVIGDWQSDLLIVAPGDTISVDVPNEGRYSINFVSTSDESKKWDSICKIVDDYKLTYVVSCNN